jgi:cellulose 1,4-beta-cellobiosidase
MRIIRSRRAMVLTAVAALTGAAVALPATPAEATSVRVTNPYRGAQAYVNPDWSYQVRAQAAATPGSLGQQMAQVAGYPTAVWLDDIDAITAGRGLAGHLDQALAQQRSIRPMVVQVVLSNVPGRDCARRAAPGELTFDEFDQARYRTEFIDPIAQILARPAYAGLRIVVIAEPGALPNLLFDRSHGFPECEVARTANVYTNAVRYALQRLGTMPNVYSYLEVPNSALGGYESNFGTFVELYTRLVMSGPGVNSVAGFVTNVAQYAPVAEPFLPNPDQTVGGIPIWQSRFIDFSRHYQELRYARAVRDAFVARGFPSSVGMLIDTGRNGWGGPDRPTQVSTSLDVTTYVNESRIDRRPTRASWCNQVGAGLGERPTADPAAGVHAYAWLTPPGESDGVASRTAAPDPDRPYLIHRNPCDPLWAPPQGSHIPSNALPDAPHYRRWFPAFFAQLVQNAHPPVPTG